MGAFLRTQMYFLLACIDHWNICNRLVITRIVKSQEFSVCVPLRKMRHCFQVSLLLIAFFCLRAPKLTGRFDVQNDWCRRHTSNTSSYFISSRGKQLFKLFCNYKHTKKILSFRSCRIYNFLAVPNTFLVSHLQLHFSICRCLGNCQQQPKVKTIYNITDSYHHLML